MEQISHKAHTVALLPQTDVVADSWKDVCAAVQKPDLALFNNSGTQAAISVYQYMVHEIVVLERTGISALHSLRQWKRKIFPFCIWNKVGCFHS